MDFYHLIYILLDVHIASDEYHSKSTPISYNTIPYYVTSRKKPTNQVVCEFAAMGCQKLSLRGEIKLLTDLPEKGLSAQAIKEYLPF